MDPDVPWAMVKTHSSDVTDPVTVKFVPGVPFKVAWYAMAYAEFG